MSSKVMLFPDGEGTIAPVEGDGVLGLFLLPNSLFGRRAMSLLPLLPLACLLKLSTYVDNNQFGAVLKEQKDSCIDYISTDVQCQQTWKLPWCPAKASRWGV